MWVWGVGEEEWGVLGEGEGTQGRPGEGEEPGLQGPGAGGCPREAGAGLVMVWGAH